jgi:predicted transcriptional regulator
VVHETNDADELILTALVEGRNTPQNLASDLGYSRQYIQNRLQLLNAAEYITNIGGGLYEITEKGQGEVDDAEPDTSPSMEYVRELEERNEDLEHSGADVDVAAVCDDLKRALDTREWSAVEDAATRLGCKFE